jgi:hypothetical protein
VLGLPGCGALQNDVNVPLPNFPPQLVVECYLEDGKVPQLTVTETVPYLGNNQTAPPGSLAVPLPNGQQVILPTDAAVTLVLADGTRQNLAFRPGLDTATNKFFTHRGTEALLARPGQTFALEVRDGRGRVVTGTTTMPARIPIDSVNYKFNDKSGAERKAYFLTNFTDPAEPGNFYHLQLQKSSLRNEAEVDYDVEDRLNNGRSFTLGTSFRFSVGDTIFCTLYHLEPAFTASGSRPATPGRPTATRSGSLPPFRAPYRAAWACSRC